MIFVLIYIAISVLIAGFWVPKQEEVMVTARSGIDRMVVAGYNREIATLWLSLWIIVFCHLWLPAVVFVAIKQIF